MEYFHHYRITKQIRQDKLFTVFIAFDEQRNQLVTLKCLNALKADLNTIDLFKREYEIQTNVHTPAILKARELIVDNDIICSVRDYFPSNYLKDILLTQRFSVISFLGIAIQMAQALNELHKCEIIHRKLTPYALLIGKDNEVRLTDLLLAKRFDEPSFSIFGYGLDTSVLPYLSPEQTERMNRNIDYRSDYYSLGIIFYEMCARELPFQAADPLEIIHAHIARMPLPPESINSEVPAQISQIIMKLLAKHAEDRYQSAFGLIHDLSTCLTLYKEVGSIPDFPLALNDVPSHFHLSDKLYGRKDEIRTALEIYKASAVGPAHYLFFTGPEGIGKTVLLNEFYKQLMNQRARIVWTRYDAHKAHVPYSALIEACQQLIIRIQAGSPEEVKHHQQLIMNALGDHGRLMTDLVPDLEALIGEQPFLEFLDFEENRNRLAVIFSRFLKLFMEPENPLVLFIDNLQSIDNPSAQLLSGLIQDDTIQYFLLIGAYRNEALSDDHPLNVILTRHSKRINLVSMSPLSDHHIAELLIDTFKTTPEIAQEVGAILFQKTAGIPVSIGECISELTQKHHIFYDTNRGSWVFALDDITVFEISLNVINTMLTRFSLLSQDIQQTLIYAACLGDLFSTDLLSEVTGNRPEITLNALSAAQKSGLIIRTESSRKSHYKFSHEQISTAILNDVPQHLLKSYHLNIGRVLLPLLNNAPAMLFSVVYHYNQGIALISDIQELLTLARLNLTAGLEARQRSAFTFAEKFFQAGYDICADLSWSNHYELKFNLLLHLYDIKTLEENTDHQAYYDDLILHSQTREHRARIMLIRLNYLKRCSSSDLVITHYLDILDLMDFKLPRNLRVTKFLSIVYLGFFVARFWNKSYADLINRPHNLSTEHELLSTIIVDLFAYLLLSEDKYPLLIVLTFKQIREGWKTGITPLTVLAYETTAAFLSMTDHYPAMKQFRDAGDFLANAYFRQHRMKSIIQFGHSITAIFDKPYSENTKELVKIYNDCVVGGYFMFANVTCTFYLMIQFLQGTPISRLLKEFERFGEFINRHGYYYEQYQLFRLYFSNLISPQIGTYYLDRDKTRTEHDLFTDYLNHNNTTLYTYSLVIKLIYLYFQDRIVEARSVLKTLMSHQRFMIAVFQYMFSFYSSLVIMAVYHSSSRTEKQAYRKLLKQNHKQFKTWARMCDTNSLSYYQIVQGIYFSIVKNDTERAIECYRNALKHAEIFQYFHLAAIANELLGRIYRERKIPELVNECIYAAAGAYRVWGAKVKEELLIKEFQLTDIKSLELTKDSADFSAQGDRQTIESIDFYAILKASQVLSSEILLSKVLQTFIKLMIENASAQRGVLIYSDNNVLRIETEGEINNNVMLYYNLLLDNYENLPKSIINYVHNTKKGMMLHDASSSNQYANDPYIQKYKPKSIFCFPIIRGKQYSSILYLENRLTPNLFTPDRMRVLEILAGQASISLENARLYLKITDLNINLEKKVKDQTKDLYKAKEEAEKANHYKSEFLASISHDLRTPLHVIIGTLDMALKDKKMQDAKEAAKKIQLALHSAERQLHLVNDILDLSKLESGNIEMHYSDFAIAELFESFSTEMSTLLGDKPIEFIVSHKFGPEDRISGDKYRLTQVITNLISNAAKFTLKGYVKLVAEKQGQRLLIQVRDTGIGLKPEDARRVFEPYSQIHSKLQEKIKGTGLGLAICRGIIAKMDGTIGVDSEPETGSTFWFEIPWIPAKAGRPGDPLASELSSKAINVSFDLKQKCVLACDDDAYNRMFIKMVLDGKINYIITDSGEQTLKTLATTPVDMVLLDINMPGMDGWDTVRHIRETNTTLPVIALTAHDKSDINKQTFIDKGFTNHLSKPFKEEDLIMLINTTLRP